MRPGSGEAARDGGPPQRKGTCAEAGRHPTRQLPHAHRLAKPCGLPPKRGAWRHARHVTKGAASWNARFDPILAQVATNSGLGDTDTGCARKCALNPGHLRKQVKSCSRGHSKEDDAYPTRRFLAAEMQLLDAPRETKAGLVRVTAGDKLWIEGTWRKLGSMHSSTV